MKDWFEESMEADKGGTRVAAELYRNGEGEPIEMFKRESRRRTVPLVAGTAGSSETATLYDIDADGATEVLCYQGHAGVGLTVFDGIVSQVGHRLGEQ